MRRSIISIFFLVQFLNLSAQSWFESNPEWTYGVTAWGLGIRVKYTIKGDTLINGKQCKVIEQNWFEIDFASNDTALFIYEQYCYEIDSAVFVLNYQGDEFHKIYDLKLKIGDQLKLNLAPCTPTLEVIDNGIEVIDNQNLYYQTVNWIEEDIQFTIYEHIGFPGNFFLHESVGCVFTDPTPIFRCYKNDLFEINPNGLDCDLIENPNSTAEINNVNSITLSPNPASDFLKINSKTIEIDRIIIMNLEGKIMIDKKVGNNEKFDISALTNGVYIALIYDSKNRFEVKKIFKYNTNN